MILGIGGCEDSPGAGVVRKSELARQRPATAPTTRSFIDSGLVRERWRFPADARDTTLVMPFLLSATDRGVWVWDARPELVFIDASGHPGARLGRFGSGPGEFRQVRDLEEDGRGGVALLDRGNLRISLVDSLGKLRRTIPISTLAEFDQFFVDPDGFTILSSAVGDARSFVHIDSAGTVTDSAPFPLPEYTQLDPLVRQSTTVQSAGSPYRAVAFRMGDGFFVSDQRRPGTPIFEAGWYLEHLDFPAVIDRVAQDGRRSTRLARMTPSIVSATIDRNTLFFLFVGKTKAYGRIVDVYAAGTTEYQCSFLLPERGIGIELHGSTLYAILGEDPFTVVALDVTTVLSHCQRNRPK